VGDKTLSLLFTKLLPGHHIHPRQQVLGLTCHLSSIVCQLKSQEKLMNNQMVKFYWGGHKTRPRLDLDVTLCAVRSRAVASGCLLCLSGVRREAGPAKGQLRSGAGVPCPPRRGHQQPEESLRSQAVCSRGEPQEGSRCGGCAVRTAGPPVLLIC